MKSPFLAYASRGIRNRLIDHYRREKKHAGVISLHEPLKEEEEEHLKIDQLADPHNAIENMHRRSAARIEIQEFECHLQELGISFSEVADNCPRQERTIKACQKVLAAARREPALLEELLRTKKLPMKALSEASGVERKTMERHRNYLVAVLLAFTNGYEIIRGHLYHLTEDTGNQQPE